MSAGFYWGVASLMLPAMSAFQAKRKAYAHGELLSF
jgi:hypothetical protein